MKEYIIISLILLAFNVNSQNNLIKNQSFEEMNTSVFNCLNQGNVNMFPTHFSTGENHSLFPCWKYVNTGIFTGTSSPTYFGIAMGIVPDLFPTIGGSTSNCQGLPDTEVFVNLDGNDSRIFSIAGSNNAEIFGLRLQTNSINGSLGFDCSPPDTKFGTGYDAPNGENYLAFFDFRAGLDLNSKVAIGSELKAPLVKDLTYKFKLHGVKMKSVENQRLTFSATHKLSTGIYYVNFRNGNEYSHFTLKIE